MKNKMSFNKPKFVLPLILLPFIYGLNYAALKITKKEIPVNQLESLNQFNTQIPDPIGLDNEKTKLQALRENLYVKREETGMQNIGADKERKIMQVEDTAINRTRHLVDSIRRANDSLRNLNEKRKKSIARRSAPKTRPRTTAAKRNYGTAQATTKEPSSKTSEKSEKELFVAQMRIIDSIQNPEKYQKTSNTPVIEKAPVLKVKKAGLSTSSYFNTITEKKPKSQATAILDQGLTVYDNSRVRIRLLDDIYIGDYLMRKGQYLYGMVSGFSGQRVILNISSVLVDGEIVEIDIKIYDNDGLEGIYIPDSLFREFLSELGANSAQTIGQQDGNGLRNSGSRGVGAALQGGLSKLTSAFGNASKRNKAKLKYNTLVYLVN